MGWAAARGELDTAALSLFAILFLWQMPHFFAIAWIFTEDYTRAGFNIHVSGERTGRQIIFYCCALIPISILPTVFGFLPRLPRLKLYELAAIQDARDDHSIGGYN